MNQLAKHIYELKLPLEGFSIRDISVYLIVGHQRNCLIDVGYSGQESTNLIRTAFQDLGLETNKTDVIITHCHEDHCGNLPYLYQEFGTIYCSHWDSVLLSNTGDINLVDSAKDIFVKSGIPLDWIGQVPISNDNCFGIPLTQIKVVQDGDVLNFHPYDLRVVDLKGHMPGMIGLLAEKEQLLFSSDHLLNKINPNIGFYGLEYHSLGDYLNNLKKIKQLNIKHLYPSHRGEVIDPLLRVCEMEIHHQQRLDEIKEILLVGAMSALEVTSKIRRYYRSGEFDKYPIAMKWMATMEIMAHLEYLFNRHEIIRYQVNDGLFLYQI